ELSRAPIACNGRRFPSGPAHARGRMTSTTNGAPGQRNDRYARILSRSRKRVRRVGPTLRSMAQTAFRGDPVNTSGELPAPGSTAPAFDLVGSDLSPVTSEGLSGQRVI